MSRKHKLAEEHAKSEGDNGNAETSFLAGYAACERDAKVMEEALEKYLSCIDEYHSQPYSADYYLYWKKEYEQRELAVKAALAKFKKEGE